MTCSFLIILATILAVQATSPKYLQLQENIERKAITIQGRIKRNFRKEKTSSSSPSSLKLKGIKILDYYYPINSHNS